MPETLKYHPDIDQENIEKTEEKSTKSGGVFSKLGKKAKVLGGAMALSSILSGQAEAGQAIKDKTEQGPTKNQEKPSVRPTAEIFNSLEITGSFRDSLVKADRIAAENEKKESEARDQLKTALTTLRNVSNDKSISLGDFNKLSYLVDDAQTGLTIAEMPVLSAYSTVNVSFLEFIQTVDPALRSRYESRYDDYRNQLSKYNNSLDLDLSAITKQKATITVERLRNELKWKNESEGIPRPPKPPKN